MGTGAITQGVDVAQLVLYLFWIFFAGLIYYLVRENHREGYPMTTESGRGVITGWPVPEPKVFKTVHGDITVPNPAKDGLPLAAAPAHHWSGAPLVPTGNPMLDGVGAGAWTPRADHPDTDYHGQPKVQPVRIARAFGVDASSVDPRGLPVTGGDGESAGTVVDLWVDVSENLYRYLEVELADKSRRVLLPMNFAKVRRNGVEVKAVLGRQFAAVPATRQADVVTMLEEEKIQAYYGGGMLYAEPSRQEPLL
jgi:photosynthetic reaction center H subunit